MSPEWATIESRFSTTSFQVLQQLIDATDGRDRVTETDRSGQGLGRLE